MTGVSIILFVLLINILAAFITTGAAESSSVASCGEGDNATSCEEVGRTGFFAAVRDTTFTGFDDAPVLVNALWITTMGLLLAAAVLLIVLAFVPLTAE